MAGRTAVATALAIFAGLLPASADAPLKRLTLRQDLLGWEAVGRVEIGQAGYCTGVLIAPDLVLTAAHCLYRAGTGYVAPATLRFRAGLSDGVALAEAGALRTVVHPGYEPGAADVARRVRHDIGLIQIATSVPVTTAAPFAAAGLAEGARDLTVVSYGKGRDDAPSWDESCGVVDRAEGLIAFDCDVTFGSSGAPVFHRMAGRRAALVSLVSSGAESRGRRLGLGMELPRAVDDLRAALRRGEGAVAAPPVAASGTTGRAVASPGSGARGTGGAKFLRP